MKIQALQVGSIGTNCYILCDEAAKVCAVIDPGAGRVDPLPPPAGLHRG